MKLITLNIWGGKVHDPLIEFLNNQKSSADIFCFQEVFFGLPSAPSIQGTVPHISSEVSDLLQDFQFLFRFSPEGSYFQGEPTQDTRVGLAVFVRKQITVLEHGGLFTYKPSSAFAQDPKLTMTGNCEFVKIEYAGQQVLIANLHGVWQASGKEDTDIRLTQSKILKEFLARHQGPKILCGDFNMLPQTQSMSVLEDGMQNVIIQKNIQSTRSELYTKAEKYSDYILVSPEIQVSDLQVPQITVSDHLPLILECMTNSGRG